MSSWTAFFDDAALFPPENAPMEDALAAHLALRDSADGDLLGPFVCRASGIDDLRVDRRPFAVSLIADTTDVVAVAAARPDLVVTSVEVPVGSPATPVGDAVVAVERRWDESWEVPDGALLKLRCGGPRPTDVPDVDAMASAITHCVALSAPFKLTAGLHQAVRGVDPLTGFTHHGFLNIAVGVQRARAGGDVTAALRSTDGTALATEFSAGPSVRDLFRSIGTCDTLGPIRDLHSLHLIKDRRSA